MKLLLKIIYQDFFLSKMIKKDWYTSIVLGVRVDRIPMKRVLKTVEDWMENNRVKRYIVTPNPEMVIEAQKDKEFKRVLNQADLRIPDGMGLKLADKRIKRLAGADVMMKLIKLADKKGWKVMLLGGKPGIAERAGSKLQERFKNLQLAVLAGPQKIKKVSVEENRNLIKSINEFKPDLLLVGFGHGKQEKWIAGNLNKLKIKVAMGVGGAIDYLVKPWLRAPKAVQIIGLEWWWRLMLQPWRLKRQLKLIKFMRLVLEQKTV